MTNRITATAAITLGLLTIPAFSQETGALEPTDKEALSEDAAKVKLDAGDSVPLPEVTPKKGAANQTFTLPESIKSLSPEKREELNKLLQDASTYVGGIRIQEAFEKIIAAEAIAPDLFQLHNLKGAAYTKIRDFGKARASFSEALRLNPNAFMSRFNITELDFVEHKFPAAEKNFKTLLTESPQMNLGTKRLIEFKILISQLAQDKDVEAKATQKKFDFMEDTPAFYFGNAAFAFDKDEEDEAHGWIRSAERIYNPQEISVYVDSFIEMGWIDNLQ